MHTIRLAILSSLLCVQSCALFRRPMVDVEHERVVLESGVEYEDEFEGVGRPALGDDEVTIDYTAWLDDGTLLHSTSDGGVPVTFRVDEAPFPGWREGIPGMKASGRRRLYLPPESAYGPEGVPGLVPPDTALMFLIELWEIAGEEPPSKPAQSQRLDAPVDAATDTTDDWEDWGADDDGASGDPSDDD